MSPGSRRRQWKVSLRGAIERHEHLDADAISCDNRCQLGQWLHGAGGRRNGTQPKFMALPEEHRKFHEAAGEVARRINAGQMDDATRMLDSGSAFARSSGDVAVALNRVRRGF
ncbi:hypothetical protein CDN99_15355 [Roseateles aquatilis]|jgi:methyl-accepting chemotaxis protein|uniref:Chemoreceptor zinc-binding domain-containing protein n=2 Tax=Roseateles aquatilis TaxID=431061 RepID=A0A246J8I6_9BURK|nr:CZB domain-containing protein [Burkholderiaceae bacterium]OWQ88850.1 hypothetical protein CDN99_15355 [Roseateles aquatilis]